MATRTPTRGRGAGRKRVSKNKQRVSATAALAGLRDRITGRLGRHADDIWGLVLVVVAALVALQYRLSGPEADELASSVGTLLAGVGGLIAPAVDAIGESV